MSVAPKLLGIVNITEDSFSDGGRFLAPDAAIAHARDLLQSGADILDLGAASSNPEAKSVDPEIEIARLAPVVAALRAERHTPLLSCPANAGHPGEIPQSPTVSGKTFATEPSTTDARHLGTPHSRGMTAEVRSNCDSRWPISIDSFSIPVQRWAMHEDVDYLNDIQGFPHEELYPELAASCAKLIVMHSVQGVGRATKIVVEPSRILERVLTFFEARISALTKAGIASDRLILDPGMGFFLGGNPEASFTMLRELPALKKAFRLPLLVSVSRKSFLRAITGRPPEGAGAASLAAELFAIDQGAEYIRTHDPGALRDALLVWKKLDERGFLA